MEDTDNDDMEWIRFDGAWIKSRHHPFIQSSPHESSNWLVNDIVHTLRTGMAPSRLQYGWRGASNSGRRDSILLEGFQLRNQARQDENEGKKNMSPQNKFF